MSCEKVKKLIIKYDLVQIVNADYIDNEAISVSQKLGIFKIAQEISEIEDIEEFAKTLAPSAPVCPASNSLMQIKYEWKLRSLITCNNFTKLHSLAVHYPKKITKCMLDALKNGNDYFFLAIQHRKKEQIITLMNMAFELAQGQNTLKLITDRFFERMERNSNNNYKIIDDYVDIAIEKKIILHIKKRADKNSQNVEEYLSLELKIGRLACANEKNLYNNVLEWIYTYNSPKSQEYERILKNKIKICYFSSMENSFKSKSSN